MRHNSYCVDSKRANGLAGERTIGKDKANRCEREFALSACGASTTRVVRNFASSLEDTNNEAHYLALNCCLQPSRCCCRCCCCCHERVRVCLSGRLSARANELCVPRLRHRESARTYQIQMLPNCRRLEWCKRGAACMCPSVALTRQDSFPRVCARISTPRALAHTQ